MRPVNLIPPEDRRGERAPLRKGASSYLIVAGLVAALAGVVVLVQTGNTVTERKAEIASLEVREAEARERAERLAAFAEFGAVSAARSTTVSNLAQSRFDWYRVLQELSLVIPDDIWLTELNGSVAEGAPGGDSAASSLAAETTGPALTMSGCGDGHEAVAGFLQDLKDIDGVTRVGITESRLREQGAASAATSGQTGEDCLAYGFLSEFDVIAVFDEVTVPASASAPADPATAAGLSTAEQPAGADADTSGVSEVQTEQQETRDSIGEQSQQSREATNLIPGVAR